MNPRRDGSPFDAPTEVPPPVSVAVGPAALAEASDAHLERLSEVSQFSFIDLHPIALDSNGESRLRRYGLSPTTLAHTNGYVSLSYEHGGMLLAPEERLTALVQGGLSKADAIECLLAGSNRLFDFCALSPRPDHQAFGCQEPWRLCDLTSLFTRLRLCLVCSRHFLVRPQFRINKGFYYLYRMHRCFPEFQPAWIIVSIAGEQLLPPGLHDQTISLGLRLQHLVRAIDESLIAALRTPGNDTEADYLYHLSNLVLLISGAYDDIAWLICHSYRLSLKGQSVTLKLDRQGHSRLLNAVRAANPTLVAHLSAADTRERIESIYPLRDRLQHREFLRTVSTGIASTRTGGLVSGPANGFKRLARATFPPQRPFQQLPGVDDEILADPEWLAEALLQAASHVVNGTLRLLPWDSALTSLSAGAQQRARDATSQFRAAASRYLHLGDEPALFG